MTIKIAVIGTHGAGKTTLCYDVAALLKKHGKSVDIVKEVARSCPLPVNKKTTKSAQAWILHTQISQEIAAESNYDVVVCDRSVLDNYAYLVHKDGKDELLGALVKEWMKTYDIVFKVPITEAPKSDNFRDTDVEWQRSIDELVDILAIEYGIKTVKLSRHKGNWIKEIDDILSDVIK